MVRLVDPYSPPPIRYSEEEEEELLAEAEAIRMAVVNLLEKAASDRISRAEALERGENLHHSYQSLVHKIDRADIQLYELIEVTLGTVPEFCRLNAAIHAMN